MIDAGRARTSINKDIDRVKRMFRWAVEEELLPGSVYERLRAVRGLGRAQTAARETDKVAPVPVEDVEAVLPHLPPPVAAMVRLQLLTGTRPQEVIGLKPGEVVDRGDGVWLYTPATHKTEHHGRDKVVVLGPKAQEVLGPWLDRDPNRYCFVPAESVAWKVARLRKGRAMSKTWKPPGGQRAESITSCRVGRLGVRRTGFVTVPETIRHPKGDCGQY